MRQNHATHDPHHLTQQRDMNDRYDNLGQNGHSSHPNQNIEGSNRGNFRGQDGISGSASADHNYSSVGINFEMMGHNSSNNNNKIVGEKIR